MHKERYCGIVFLVFLTASSPWAWGQEAKGEVQGPPIPPFNHSLLFSPLELTALQRAQVGLSTGQAALNVGKTEQAIPARRVIAVAGVVWRSPQDWMVWINGKKVTQNALLPEIVDIYVEKDQVKLKWFDIGINAVLSISLRPHQTYDIVTGVLLPG